jgi:hypothetical protein
MSTSPPSVGNRVRLNPLEYTLNSVAYTTGYIELASVEPSLGIPTGYTFTEVGSAYYFPIFGISNTYAKSRKFTGNNSLIYKNKNLGINNPNPTYNVDISGTLRATDATVATLQVTNLVGQNSLTVNFPNGVTFNTPVIFNYNVNINDIFANNISTYNLNAENLIYSNTITEVNNLVSADISEDLNISANLTATNIFATNSISSVSLNAVNSNFNSVIVDGGINVKNNLNVENNVYANNIYGKIAIDDSSQLYYNENNQLSISKIKDYWFAIRPSDSYSTDNINVARTLNGPKDDGSDEESYVLKPYFKNVQAVIDYVYTNGIYGNNLTIWVDEDIIAGENRANRYTEDNSGYYAGCTVTGNLSAAFYSTEFIQNALPSLYEAGLRGGDYIWCKDTNSIINGQFYYIELYPINFNNINIQGRYEIGSYINSNGTKLYSTSRPFNFSPRKITFRTYICSDTSLPFRSFNTDPNSWLDVYTKSSVQGRQVQFNQSQSVFLNLINLCFEFNTNSCDSSGLIFYNGNNRINNVTVALQGTGIYSYGAINVESEYANVEIRGSYLLDPFYLGYDIFGNSVWNTWNNFGFSDPNYFPGYGLAIMGNIYPNTGVIVNYNESNPECGLINIKDGGNLRVNDFVNGRKYGNNSFIQNSIILDGTFIANTLFNLDNKANLFLQQNMFRGDTFDLSSFFIAYNNTKTNDTFLAKITNNQNNFKYINFNGSFATFNPHNNSFANWTFRNEDSLPGIPYNTYLSVNNNFNDPYYVFSSQIKPFYATLTNSVNSIGHINYMASSTFNTNNLIYYVNVFGLKKYNEYGIFNLNSPTQQIDANYTLNFYTQSTR